MKREKIYSYDALRGLCAVGILFSHMSYLANASNPFWRAVWKGFMRFGGSCSSFFFVLSGFLVCYTWKDKPFGEYIKGKLKRIYPLSMCVFVLALLVTVVLSGNEAIAEKGVATGSPLWFFNIVMNISLLKAFVPDERVFYSFHAPSWYLSVLLVFYIVAYVFLKRLKNEGPRRHWRKAISWICAGTYAAEFAVCVAVSAFNIDDLSLYLCYINPYFRIFGECFAGILLCEFMPDIQKSIEARRWSKSVLEIGSLILYLAFFLIRNIISTTLFAAWLQIIPVSAMLIAFRNDSGCVSHVFLRREWQYLGKISFELYMTHAFVYEGLPVIFGIANPVLRDWLMNHGGTRFMITFVISIIFAGLVNAGTSWLIQRKDHVAAKKAY